MSDMDIHKLEPVLPGVLERSDHTSRLQSQDWASTSCDLRLRGDSKECWSFESQISLNKAIMFFPRNGEAKSLANISDPDRFQGMDSIRKVILRSASSVDYYDSQP